MYLYFHIYQDCIYIYYITNIYIYIIYKKNNNNNIKNNMYYMCIDAYFQTRHMLKPKPL